jgi:hypothetical protein
MTDQPETTTVKDISNEPVNEIEQELDVYPLRDPSEDPRWALWVIWIWISISVFLFLFFVVLFILGIWYD